MRKAAAGLLGAAVVALFWVGCGEEPPPPPPGGCTSDCGQPDDGGGNGNVDAGPGDAGGGGTDAGTDGGNGGTDAGTDGGTGGTDGGNDGGTDGGTGGTDGGTDGGVDAGPSGDPTAPQSVWPTDAVKNYSTAYGVPSVQSVGIDDGHNIWVLSGSKIGLLTSDSGKITWGSNIGQAGRGFSSTVICGGAAGKAYVGYSTYDLPSAHLADWNDPEYQKGDADLVRMTTTGIALETHLSKTTDTSHHDNLGIRNTNNWEYDEDRSVLSCVKVHRGPIAGSVILGFNHGVTRVEGDMYNSHIHVVWHNASGSQMTGYNYAVGVNQKGDILIGNDWMYGLVTPPAPLKDWDNQGDVGGLNNFRLAGYVPLVNSLEEFDFWRGIAMTTEEVTYEGRAAHYLYLGNIRPDGYSVNAGLFRLTVSERATSYKMDVLETVKVDFPHQVTALNATDDGSLFIGTYEGLYVMNKDHSIEKVSGVPGSRVKQLVYDPTQSPSMLLVLTDSGLTAIRGR